MFKEIDSGKNLKESSFQKLIIKVVFFIFPKANPDYEDEIDNAVYWLLEFGDERCEHGNIPSREIGLDENYKSILKMPYKKNYGYWLDTNVTYSYCIEKFNAESVGGDYFEEKWGELV